MSNRNPGDDRSATDQILDLLLDALVERQKARRGQAQASKPPASTTRGQN